MANSKKQHASMPKYTLDQTIFFLRPINKEAIAILNATENDPYRFEVAPPDELTDQPSGEISDEDFASSGESGEQLHGKMSEVAPQTHNPSNSVSTESSRDACQIHPFAFRFGFDSIENPSRNGFTFGGAPRCDVQLTTPKAKRYFRIHYVFKSGALLITAYEPITVGDKRLQKSQSLALMPKMMILCGEDILFSVEFPDVDHCAESHMENYRQYSMKCGVDDALYMPTFTVLRPVIEHHICLAVLGKGGFGTVYEAVNMQNGKKVALKLTVGEPSISKEVEIMQELRHVS